MTTLPLGTVFKASLIGSVVAALLVATFHYIATEPIIEQSIAIEENLSAMGASHEHEAEPVFSRDVQRVGLFVGYLLYGLTWGIFFAVAFTLSQHVLPGATAAQRGLVLAALGFWALGLFPFLKYPANPPGVGEPESIGLRQALYIAVLAIGVLSAIVAVALGRQVGRGKAPAITAVVTVGALAVIGGIAFAILPANPDEIRLPMPLVESFRLHSLIGVALFWSTLGVVFAALAHRTAPQPLPRQVSAPV